MKNTEDFVTTEQHLWEICGFSQVLTVRYTMLAPSPFQWHGKCWIRRKEYSFELGTILAPTFVLNTLILIVSEGFNQGFIEAEAMPCNLKQS